MLPVLPFLIGGALGTVAGVALKKYYDDNDIEIHEKLENSLMDIEEWLDEKLVALAKYKDSLNLNDDENTISSTSKEYSLKKQRLEKMPASERKKILIELNKQMKKAAADLNFEEAIRLRDEIAKIKEI